MINRFISTTSSLSVPPAEIDADQSMPGFFLTQYSNNPVGLHEGELPSGERVKVILCESKTTSKRYAAALVSSDGETYRELMPQAGGRLVFNDDSLEHEPSFREEGLQNDAVEILITGLTPVPPDQAQIMLSGARRLLLIDRFETYTNADIPALIEIIQRSESDDQIAIACGALINVDTEEAARAYFDLMKSNADGFMTSQNLAHVGNFSRDVRPLARRFYGTYKINLAWQYLCLSLSNSDSNTNSENNAFIKAIANEAMRVGSDPDSESFGYRLFLADLAMRGYLNLGEAEVAKLYVGLVIQSMNDNLTPLEALLSHQQSLIPAGVGKKLATKFREAFNQFMMQFKDGTSRYEIVLEDLLNLLNIVTTSYDATKEEAQVYLDIMREHAIPLMKDRGNTLSLTNVVKLISDLQIWFQAPEHCFYADPALPELVRTVIKTCEIDMTNRRTDQLKDIFAFAFGEEFDQEAS